MPWRNGGGVTTELWIAPAGATLDSFDWRLSMARIDVPGPFSTFAGIDRVLAVLEGRLRLRIQGRPETELAPGDPAIAFAGELAVEGIPLAGPVLDLNLMLRRAAFTGSVQRVELTRPMTLQPQAAVTALLSRSEGVDCESGTTHARLGRDDLLVAEAPVGALQVRPGGDGVAAFYRVELHPR